jgi:hypothetical protein
VTLLLSLQVKLSGDKKVNKESFKTNTIKGDANPRWFGENKFTLYDVRAEVSWCPAMGQGPVVFVFVKVVGAGLRIKCLSIPGQYRGCWR